MACLIRRLNNLTNHGKIRCIATSATVQSGDEEEASYNPDFAPRLFGEYFDKFGNREDYVKIKKLTKANCFRCQRTPMFLVT